MSTAKKYSKGAAPGACGGQMPSGVRSANQPALVTAPRLWGQTKNNTGPAE